MDALNTDGWSALHVAAHTADTNLDVVKLLVALGAAVGVRGRQGRTAEDLARARGFAHTADALGV